MERAWSAEHHAEIRPKSKAVYAILVGKPVRLQTLAHLRACVHPISP